VWDADQKQRDVTKACRSVVKTPVTGGSNTVIVERVGKGKDFAIPHTHQQPTPNTEVTVCPIVISTYS